MVRTFLRSVVSPSIVIILLVLAVSSEAFGQAGNPFFTPPTFPGSGQSISADVNGDGKPDLLFFDGTVLLGKGDGTFTTGTSWQAPGTLTASQFAIADFNGDGKPDIFVAGPLNKLSVLLGNGDGTFQAAMTTSIVAPATTFLVGDLNGDGKPDVLAQVGSTFLTFIGKGDGTFTQNGITSNASSASQFDSFVDFNGDGKLDLFVFNQAVVQLGNRDGTFQAPVQLPSATPPLSGLAGDFDGDGKLDIAAFLTGSQVQILFGNGDGTFHAGSVQPFGFTSAITAVDLNGDGKADLITATAEAVEVLTGKGDGTFTAGTLYNTAQTSGTIIVADFNGDGKKDVAAFHTMLLGNGDGTLQGDPVAPGILSVSGAGVPGDFNGDGSSDVATTTFGSGTSFHLNIWLNDGKTNFSLAHTYNITIPFPGVDSNLVTINSATDINGDGKVDLVGFLWDASGLSLMTLLGNGDGSFGSPILSLIGGDPYSGRNSATLTLGDLNGDKKADALVNMDTNGQVTFNVLLNHGDGTFGPPSNPFVGTPFGPIAVGDFNKDGKPDVIMGTTTGIAISLGNGDGTFQPTTFVTSAACQTQCTSILGGDFNGDGNLDLIVPAGTGYQVLSGKGDGTFNVGAAVPTGLSNLSFSQAVDINGDEHFDVLGQAIANGGLETVLLLGKGDGTFAAPFSYVVNGTPLLGDFNGDGKPDIGVLTTSQLVLLINSAQVGPPAPPTSPDFSLGSGTGGTTATVAAGSTATYTLSLAGTSGFTAPVALTCSVAPVGPTCSVSPSSVLVNPSAAVSATVSVVTTARSEILPFGGSRENDSSRRILWIFSLSLAAVGFLAIFAFARVNLRRFSWSVATVCGAIVLIGASLLAGCGGGSSSSSTGSNGSSATGTPAGSYTVTVTAQARSVIHTTQLTLTVQ